MKNITTLSRSTSVVIIMTVILTIGSELSKQLKDFLTSITGHHWITKSVIAVLLFIILSFMFSNTQEKNVLTEIKNVVWVTILGTVAIFGFYLWHYVV